MNRLESAHYSSHVVAATLVSFWLSLSQTQAQSRETAFGQVRRYAVPGRFEQFALAKGYDGTSLIYLWNRRGTEIATARLDSTGRPHEWRKRSVNMPFDDFMVVDLSPEQKHVGVVTDRTEHRMSFIADLEVDTLRSMTTMVLPLSPTKVVFGDLNNDSKTDFVVIDRGNPGVVPFLGIGGGKFRPGRVMAEDYAIADLAVTNLNNDNILDVVCYDWIRSNLHLLYGVGQGRFLDQLSFQVEGEVRSLAVSALVGRGSVDIVMGFTYPGKIEILGGDGLGDFTLRQSIPLREPLITHLIRDINGDGRADIIGIDGSSVVHVFLNSGDGRFEDQLDYVGGQASGQLALSDHVGGNLPYAVLFERGNQNLITLLNGSIAARLVDSVDFAAAPRPRGVVIADINGDGHGDVAVASAGSNSVSFHLNDGFGGFYGATSFPLPASATDLAVHSFRDSTMRLLVSYPGSNQVSVLSIEMNEGIATNATIPTERSAEFLYWDSQPTTAVELFCFSPPTSSSGALLTLFQEIPSQQFIERVFQLSPASTLVAAGVGLINGDEIADVAFVNKIAPTGRSELAVSYGDSLYSFRQKSVIYDLPGKVIGQPFVWIVRSDHADRPDIMLYQPGSPPVLQRFRQTKDQVFDRPDTVATNVRIASRGQMRFLDFDGDGILDIVVRDASRGALGWMKGRGSSFDPFVPLCPATGRTRYAVGRLNDDEIMDVVLTFEEIGLLRMYDGKLLLSKHR